MCGYRLSRSTESAYTWQLTLGATERSLSSITKLNPSEFMSWMLSRTLAHRYESPAQLAERGDYDFGIGMAADCLGYCDWYFPHPPLLPQCADEARGRSAFH